MQFGKLVRKILTDMFCENGEVSLTRVLTALYFILFASVTVYLVLMAEMWSCYDVFATLAGGAGVAGQVGNKLINSKYNTMPGRFDSAPNQNQRGA